MKCRIVSFLSVMLLLITAIASAGIPQLINYQGRLTASGGAPINDTVLITFAVYDAVTGGNLKWIETQPSVVVTDGLFNVLLGSVSPIPDSLFNDADRYLGIRINTDPEISPRTRLVTVPWSYRVGTIDGSAGGIVTGDVSIYGRTSVGQNIIGGVYGFSSGQGNTNNSNYGFVAGRYNQATGTGASICGGRYNHAEGEYSVVGGGGSLEPTGGNLASGDLTFIGGGKGNEVTGNSSVICGGVNNYVAIDNGVICGGDNNTIDSGQGCFIGGGGLHPSGPLDNPGNGANYVSGDFSIVVGGADNYVDGDFYNSILGGERNYMFGCANSWIGGGLKNKLAGEGSPYPRYSVICGGELNKMSGSYSFLGAGFDNDVFADASAIVSGGYLTQYSMGNDRWVFINRIDTNATYSFIGTGWGNHCGDSCSLVLGGVHNYARGKFSIVVGGGADFDPLMTGPYVPVDSNSASGDWSVILGGKGHVASGLASAVGGGSYNRATGNYSVISGGGGSSVSDANTASGAGSTIGGGAQNTASGPYTTVPGGYGCEAGGQFATAMGRYAKAYHYGSFVWADASGSPFNSTNTNQFNVRAAGGTRIFSNGSGSVGVELNPGSGTWTSVSDSTLKRNIREVDYFAVLDKVAELSISYWSYISQDENIEHIGPMSQDFYRLFSVGDNNTTISAVDPDGVALAAIKALYEKCKKVDELETEVAQLRKLVEQLIANQE